MNKKSAKLKNAFTLAEVLITLAIIGAIAAITIPGLKNKIDDKQHLGHWKKYVSILTTSSLQIGRERDLNVEPIGFRDSDGFKNLFMPYLKYTKSCNVSSTIGNCWHSSTSDIANRYGHKPENAGWLYTNNNINFFSGLVLADGAFVIFMPSNTTFYPYCNGYTYPGGKFCGEIRVDVNGFKGPNREGVDIFGGKYGSNGRFIPYGGSYNYCGSSACSPDRCTQKTQSTLGCSATRLIE